MDFNFLARKYRDGQVVGSGYFAEIIRFDYPNERIYILKPSESVPGTVKVRTAENLTATFPNGLANFPALFYPFVIQDKDAIAYTTATLEVDDGNAEPLTEYEIGYLTTDGNIFSKLGQATKDFLKNTTTARRAVSMAALQGRQKAKEIASKPSNSTAFRNALRQTLGI